MEKTNGVDIVIGLIPRYGRVDKYVMYKDDGSIYFATPTELFRSLGRGENIVGLRRSGRGVTLSGMFKYRGVLGQESDDVWTIVRQHLYKKKRRFDLCDCVGNIRNISEDDLKDEAITGKSKINGMLIRGDQLLVPKIIPIMIEKSDKEV